MNSLDNSILQRRSAMAFEPKEMSKDSLEILFEAARWAPSAYNDQPWKFYFAHRSNPVGFEKLLSLLVSANREWAQNASVIVISTARTVLSLNGKENFHAMHDTGIATANLLVMAQQHGFVTHVMGGFDRNRAAEVLNFSSNEIAVAAIAVGFAGDENLLSEANRKRANNPRQRKPLLEVAVEVQK
jgi:nitroreductase